LESQFGFRQDDGWVRTVVKLEVDVVGFVVGTEFHSVIAPIQALLSIRKNSSRLMYLSGGRHHQIKTPRLSNPPFQIKCLQLYHHYSFRLLLKQLSIFYVKMEYVFALIVRNPFLFFFLFNKVFRNYLLKILDFKFLFHQGAMGRLFDPFALEQFFVSVPFFLLFFRELKWLEL